MKHREEKKLCLQTKWLRKVFEPNRDEVSGLQRTLHVRKIAIYVGHLKACYWQSVIMDAVWTGHVG